MKRQFVLLFAAVLCATLLGGCRVIYTPESGLDVRTASDNLSKAQRIVISDAETGKELAVFNGGDEVGAFLDSLGGDRWKMADLPEDAERECVISMYQTETIKAGMKPEDAQTFQVCTLYTYRGSSHLTMDFPFMSATFTISDSAAEYLHSFAQ